MLPASFFLGAREGHGVLLHLRSMSLKSPESFNVHKIDSTFSLLLLIVTTDTLSQKLKRITKPPKMQAKIKHLAFTFEFLIFVPGVSSLL